MIILSKNLRDDKTDEPVSPLNAIWFGNAPQTIPLPQLEHLFLICPLGETMISCAGAKVDSEHYILLTQGTATIENLRPNAEKSPLLILMISPFFIVDMANFLNITADFYSE